MGIWNEKSYVYLRKPRVVSTNTTGQVGTTISISPKPTESNEPEPPSLSTEQFQVREILEHTRSLSKDVGFIAIMSIIIAMCQLVQCLAFIVK